MTQPERTSKLITSVELLSQMEELSYSSKDKEDISHQILAWTEGQPILTSYILQIVQVTQESTLNGSAADTINDLVRHYFSTDILHVSPSPENQDVLQLLKQINHDLLAERPIRDRLLKTYQDILLFRHQVPSGYTAEQQILLDIGIVTQSEGRGLKVANPIYRRVFNRRWVDNYLRQPFSLHKEHWVLFTVLLSVLAFITLQSLFRYAPIVQTRRCNQENDLKNAIHANFSLDPSKMQQAIARLRGLQSSNQLTDSCQEILYDLEYNYAIYFEAGVKNQPLNAAKRLCGIPPAYFKENDIRPWFRRWTHIYQSTDFSINLSQYIKESPCPVYPLLNSAESEF